MPQLRHEIPNRPRSGQIRAGEAHSAGNAFEVAGGEGYDLALLTNFLHRFDGAKCTDILRRAGAALAPDGSVAIIKWAPYIAAKVAIGKSIESVGCDTAAVWTTAATE